MDERQLHQRNRPTYSAAEAGRLVKYTRHGCAFKGYKYTVTLSGTTGRSFRESYRQRSRRYAVREAVS